MTEYEYRVTIACPEPLIPKANDLACILGESSADIKTFSAARYENSEGARYAVCSSVVTSTFMAAQTEGLPNPIPGHATEAGPVRAQEALDTLNAPGGLMMVVGDDPKASIQQMGLSLIATDILI